MLPILKLATDGAVHKASDVVSNLGKQFQLSEEELATLLPSGNQRIFTNRIGWAVTYLKKAGLLESAGRAVFQITSTGRALLSTNPQFINNALLSQYESFVAFRKPQDVPAVGSHLSTAREDNALDTPESRIAQAQSELEQQLQDQIVEQLQGVSWQFFEVLVLKLLTAMGYGGGRESASQLLGRTRDGGVDGLVNEDVLGLDTIYVQAKKWKDPVGSPALRDFVGALASKNARKGVFLTASSFTAEAKDFIRGVNGYSIVLIDGQEMARRMIEYNVGVQQAGSLILKRIDRDFFDENAQ